MTQFHNDPPGDVPGYVYFVHRGTAGVKVGSSRYWPTGRIIGTRGLHSRDLLLILETHSCRELEKELHRKLRPRRIRKPGLSDTFDLDKATLSRIADGFSSHTFRGELVAVTILPAFDEFQADVEDIKADVYSTPTSLSGRRMRGQYVQVTFRLPEHVVSNIARMAVEAGVSQEDLKRWLVWRGLQAWADGERPETDEDVVRRVRVEWGGAP